MGAPETYKEIDNLLLQDVNSSDGSSSSPTQVKKNRSPALDTLLESFDFFCAGGSCKPVTSRRKTADKKQIYPVATRTPIARPLPRTGSGSPTWENKKRNIHVKQEVFFRPVSEDEASFF
mmetsp:Transcript_26538/g.37398  ORF Transcript_26538/g.37398 Transcript_26538/m.37398 type:complete len:120 (+) Transcript_26538:55-414(+)